MSVAHTRESPDGRGSLALSGVTTTLTLIVQTQYFPPVSAPLEFRKKELGCRVTSTRVEKIEDRGEL